METNVCPWCQTEIVWDEEIGPEAECPHCQNELNEYRTINIGLDEDEEQQQPEPKVVTHSLNDGLDSEESYWEEDSIGSIPAFRALDKYETTHDLIDYDKTVEKVLDEQVEVPECPFCHEYMLLAGQQKMTDSDYKPFVFNAIQAPILSAPFTVNMYICSGCFHVQSSLNEEDRVRLIEALSGKKL